VGSADQLADEFGFLLWVVGIRLWNGFGLSTLGRGGGGGEGEGYSTQEMAAADVHESRDEWAGRFWHGGRSGLGVRGAVFIAWGVPIPRIAIVGRPNVGKSSLLNMIAREKVSIVDPTPGTTRDRVSVVTELEPPYPDAAAKPVEVVDTGGYGVYTAEDQRFNEIGVDLHALKDDIEKQIGEAVRNSDLILFAIDAQAGITPVDEQIATMLREGKFWHGKMPAVHVVATKVDGPKWEAHGLETAALGFGEPLMVSAKNNYFRREFVDALYDLVPAVDLAELDAATRVDMKLAIIGKRNAGKSSLVNALAGEQRVIVSEIAGTTRDAIDVRFELDGKSLLAIDTAGLRRKKSFANRIEWWAFDRAKRAIDRSDVVFLLVDATEPLSQVDEQLAMLVQKAYRPCVIVVNKWDLVEGKVGPKGRPVTPEDYEEYLRKELRGLDFAPISFIAASTGRNIRKTVRLGFEVLDQARSRVGTGQLNRLVRAMLERFNPPSKLGTLAKVYYVAQVAVHPPTIVMVVNRPELFTPNYQRFLLNRFREELPFGEVPIRMFIRGRKRRETIELAEEQELSAEEVAEVEHEALAAAEEMGGAAGDEEDAEAYFREEP
jgi:GTPase